jgi:hypothetical protein
MHHTSIYFANVAQAVLIEIAAQQDQIIAIQNSHLFPPRDLPLKMAFAHGVTLARARISTPKTRQIAIPVIPGIEQAALPPDNPYVWDLRRNPYILPREEEIAIEIFQNAVGAEDEWAVLSFDYPTQAALPVPDVIPSGDVTVLRATGTTVQTADAWSDITLTYDQQLPVGLYAVIGAQMFGATAHAFRLILDGQYPRPGGIPQLNPGGRPWEGQVMGGMGVWGTFRTVSLPRLQVYSDAADAAQEVWIQVVRVG